MLTPSEAERLSDIKARLKAAGRNAVCPEEQQWVLNLVAREQVPVKQNIVKNAKNAGYQTAGIVTK